MISQQQSPTVTTKRLPAAAARVNSALRGACTTELQNLAGLAENSSLPLRTIGITSCYDNEGVTTLAAHLATAAADAMPTNRRVLLVEANVVWPSLHRMFRIDPVPGLVESVSDGTSRTIHVQQSPTANLSILTAGGIDGDPTQVNNATEGFRTMIDDLQSDFDLIVFDMPSIGNGCPATNLYRLLDGVIMVVESERVGCRVAQRAQRTLEQAGAKLLGVVMNKRRHRIPGWLYRRL